MEQKSNGNTQGKSILKVKLDVIFKMLFSEHKDLLKELLAALLDLHIESISDISVNNSEILPNNISGKTVRMDINMEVGDKLINVEMQYGSEDDYIDRTLFYWARLHSDQLQSGDEYEASKQSICVNIVNQKYFDCKEYHSHFAVLEKSRHEVLTDKCAIHFFELPKISKTIDKDDITQLWLQLINAETEEEFDMLSQTGVEPIKQAVEVVHEMSEDKKIREMARIREETFILDAMKMGAARREGRKEGRMEVAKNLLSIDMPIEQVASVTGLTQEEITLLGSETIPQQQDNP